MKAYSISVNSEPDYGQEIIWSKNTKEARESAWYTTMSENAESFIDLRVIRAPEFDDCENMNAEEFAWKQHQEGWIWYEIPQLNDDDLTKEEFLSLARKGNIQV